MYFENIRQFWKDIKTLFNNHQNDEFYEEENKGQTFEEFVEEVNTQWRKDDLIKRANKTLSAKYITTINGFVYLNEYLTNILPLVKINIEDLYLASFNESLEQRNILAELKEYEDKQRTIIFETTEQNQQPEQETSTL